MSAFHGIEVRELGDHHDGPHRIRVVLMRFPDGTERPYVELSESHDGGGPPRRYAFETLVHLAQNVGDVEAHQIGNRDPL